MSNNPPADQIKNPGRKPSWTKNQMEEAIDRYFEVGNFNRVAKECSVPVSTLFYKVKIDPRYGKELPKEKEEEAKPEPASPEEEGTGWEQFGELAALGLAFYGGYKVLSWSLDEFSDTPPEGKPTRTDREKIKAASTQYRQMEENLRRLTGLTDPFARRVKPRHIAEAVADSLGIAREKIDKNLVERVARDWQDPGPLEEEIDLGKYKTVPASQISSDWKDKLDQLAEDENREIKAYLKDKKYDWGAILTTSGKMVRYYPGLSAAEEWMKALRWDHPENFG